MLYTQLFQSNKYIYKYYTSIYLLFIVITLIYDYYCVINPNLKLCRRMCVIIIKFGFNIKLKIKIKLIECNVCRSNVVFTCTQLVPVKCTWFLQVKV